MSLPPASPLVAGTPVGLARFRAFACNMSPPAGSSVIRKAHTLSVSSSAPSVASQLPPIVAAFQTLPRRQRGIYLVWPGTTFFFRSTSTRLAVYNGDSPSLPDHRPILRDALISGTLDLGKHADHIYGTADSLTNVERLAVAGAAFQALTPPEGEEVGVGSVITEGSMEYAFYGLDVALDVRKEPVYQAAIDAICDRDGLPALDWAALASETVEAGISELSACELTHAMTVMQKAIQKALIDAGWFTLGDLERGDSELVIFNAGINAAPLAQTTTGWAKWFPRSTFRTPSKYLFELRFDTQTGLTLADQSVPALEAQALEMISALASPGGSVFGSPAHEINFDGAFPGGLTSPEQIAASQRVAEAVVEGGHSSLVFWSSGGANDNAEHTAVLGEFDTILNDALASTSISGRQPMGVVFDRATYAEVVEREDPIYHVRFGKSSPTNIVGAGSTVYAGTPEHGIPSNIFAEPLAADNVGTRFVNNSTTPTNYVNLGTVFGTLGSTFKPAGSPGKNFAIGCRFKMDGANNQRTCILGNQDASNGLQIMLSSRAYAADPNYCEVWLKRDGANFGRVGVQTAGLHADGFWHTIGVLYDAVADKFYAIFDNGIAVGTTALTADGTTNPWSITGTLAGFGNFNTSFYAAAYWSGSAVTNLSNNVDLTIAEIIVWSGPTHVNAGTLVAASPTRVGLRSVGRRALGFDGRGMYFPQATAPFWQKSRTGHGALLLFADSQTTQAVERRAWIGGLNAALAETVGVSGSWSAGMVAHQGSYPLPYDGIARNGIASGTARGSWPAELLAGLPDHQIVVSDPGTLSPGNPSTINIAATSLVGSAWVLADGATVASGNASSWIWTVASSPFDSSAALKVYLRCIGKTTGSGSGEMNVVLKNGSDILGAATITCKGPMPAGARDLGGGWYEFDHAISIAAGTRASSTYTLYGARSEISAGSAGPCGISFAAIGLAAPVGVQVGVYASEGGRSMRYINRQLEDVGAARMAAFLRAAAQPAIMAGQSPNLMVMIAQGFNDINDVDLSLAPDGTFTPATSSRFGGLQQNFEWFLRHLEDAAALAGLQPANVCAMVTYLTSASDAWYMERTYAAALEVAKARDGVSGKIQLGVLAMPEVLEHADMNAMGAFADGVHATRSGFLRHARAIVNVSLDATSQFVGEQIGNLGVGGGSRQFVPVLLPVKR